MIPLVANPVTVTVSTVAGELTGVAVSVVEVIAAGFTPWGVQAI